MKPELEVNRNFTDLLARKVLDYILDKIEVTGTPPTKHQVEGFVFGWMLHNDCNIVKLPKVEEIMQKFRVVIEVIVNTIETVSETELKEALEETDFPHGIIEVKEINEE